MNAGKAIIQDRIPVLNQFDFASPEDRYTAAHAGGVIVENPAK